MALQKRDKVQIYASILVAILQELRQLNEAKLTRVQFGVRVPFDRFKAYIDELRLLRFVENKGGLRLTPKGREFLHEYARLLDLLNKREDVFGESTLQELLEPEATRREMDGAQLRVRLSRAGNSLRMTIPSHLARSLGWQHKDMLDIERMDDEAILVRRRKPGIGV